MIRQISLTPITWVHGRPDNFNCFACQKSPATWHRQIEVNDVVVNLVLCVQCAQMPPRELMDSLDFLGERR